MMKLSESAGQAQAERWHAEVIGLDGDPSTLKVLVRSWWTEQIVGALLA
jgi:hypothetical protein